MQDDTFFHELKRSRVIFTVWTAVVAFMLLICIVIYPEMQGQMDTINEMSANLGSFTSAFGMDSVNFGEIMGYYAIECGQMMGLGGGMFAALLAISLLCGEEKNHTAEFLLTHPLSRKKIVTQKFAAGLTLIVLFNLIISAVSAGSFLMIGESLDVGDFLLLHLAFLIMQIEIAAICAMLSAFLRHGGTGIGLGLCALFYFMNIVSNITDNMKFLKYITPFSYAEAANILEKHALNTVYLLVGCGITLISVFTAYRYYLKKDIYA